MKNRYSKAILFLFVFLSASSLHSQTLPITTNQTAQQLTDALVGAGILSNNVSGQLHPLGTGTFVNNGVVGFSLSGGIIMSTGLVDANIDVAASYHHSTDIGLAGDPDLDNIVFPRLTEDAEILEFDFKASSDSVEFNFVFASEEYNDYANTNFNDVFAFFVTGPGYTNNTNVALVPGTNIPVSINTINNGNSGGPSMGPCLNCNYFIDNVGSGAVGLCYDGFTTVINIKFPVMPCTDYHFKIAIADAGDGVFDSAVMLEENSFVACPNIQIANHGVAVTDTLYICAGGNLTLTAPPGPVYSWTTGESTQSITVSQPGNYGFVITDPQSTCFAISDFVTVVQSGAIQTPVIVQNGNILNAPNLIPAPSLTYQWSLDGFPIASATSSSLNINANGCYTLTIFEGTCESTSNMICVTNTSIHELNSDAIKVIPHPVTNISVIETPFEDGTISTLHLYDITGRPVQLSERNAVQHQPILKVEKGNLPSGIYLLEISNSNYQGTILKKIVVQ